MLLQFHLHTAKRCLVSFSKRAQSIIRHVQILSSQMWNRGVWALDMARLFASAIAAVIAAFNFHQSKWL